MNNANSFPKHVQFPKQLFDILQNESPEIICWSDSGGKEHF
jgi:hypothetical protein